MSEICVWVTLQGEKEVGLLQREFYHQSFNFVYQLKRYVRTQIKFIEEQRGNT
jgi:hypothetical protein